MSDAPAPPDLLSASKRELEEGAAFTPRFGPDGLIICVTRAAEDGEILMVAYMNAEALRLTLTTGEAHYWSRSRQSIWRKGATSGQTQKVREIRADCDQDALLLTIEAGGDGGACHTGRRSCFYRRLSETGDGETVLLFDQA
ncbi:Phosphoribosyl-AMP cyclohydrolase [Methylocella silvestris BL2]|uniref:Phosphoribosyl-AMP cyclohydrolase n=1 Tax=Methylocella silvestris (strain DSM 15510 / CIP 108128 / LMG 27833 / NCIMB 13906 / BL2) TaxID=395965 RepID=B8EQR3_METSB|nr:phosphoribosyl-AMP cyclohydrolase [Methylocella silvestris]ACK49334.1 Phosphoribosyl-AMP cyclohydrolase [Methylocella silvestris BL2]